MAVPDKSRTRATVTFAAEIQHTTAHDGGHVKRTGFRHRSKHVGDGSADNRTPVSPSKRGLIDERFSVGYRAAKFETSPFMPWTSFPTARFLARHNE